MKGGEGGEQGMEGGRLRPQRQTAHDPERNHGVITTHATCGPFNIAGSKHGKHAGSEQRADKHNEGL